MDDPAPPHVFVSYASADQAQVTALVADLERASIPVWLDQTGIPGGANYGPEIVAAIRESGALLVCCSAAAFASRNVRQEVALAWKHERPILPLLLERVAAPDDLAYWLEAAQWVELLDRPESTWLPEVLHGLVRAGVAVAPPPRDSPPSSTDTPGPVRLPTPLTALLGRDAEVRDAAALLAGHRLVTLTGPGGVGKTRLAIEAARAASPSFPDGVTFVDLSALRAAELVLPTIAQSLGTHAPAGQSLDDALADHINERRLLLVLDNLEQVVAAAAGIAALLTACPHLAVLATSRVLLGVRGESALPVEPLPIPDAGEPTADVAASPAVALFVARAREARPGFAPDAAELATVAAICRRLDGLPLAVELAAARARLLPPAALLARLERTLPILAAGARDLPDRQRTMASAIAWSHDLLAADEQVLFRRLAVFVGGCTLEAAEAVAGSLGSLQGPVLDGLAVLVDNSLLRQEAGPNGDGRFRMFETVREFGLERLAMSGEHEAARRAHAAHVLAFAERVEPGLESADAPWWAHLVESEHGNVDAALGWFERGADAAAVQRLAGALEHYWYDQCRWGEGRGWLERALAAGAAAPDAVRAKALVAAGFLAHYQGEEACAVPWLEAGLALNRALGDIQQTAIAAFYLGVAAEDRGDYALARAALTEALEGSRAVGDQVSVAWCLIHLGIVAFGEQDLRLAVALGEEGRALARELGATDPASIATLHLAHVACAQGDHARAAAWFREEFSADPQWSAGTEWQARAAAGLATLAAACGDAERAARLFGAAAAARAEVGLALALPERDVYEQATAAATARLGEAAFTAAWAAGRAAGTAAALADIEAVLARAAGTPHAEDERTHEGRPPLA